MATHQGISRFGFADDRRQATEVLGDLSKGGVIEGLKLCVFLLHVGNQSGGGCTRAGDKVREGAYGHHVAYVSGNVSQRVLERRVASLRRRV